MALENLIRHEGCSGQREHSAKNEDENRVEEHRCARKSPLSFDCENQKRQSASEELMNRAGRVLQGAMRVRAFMRPAQRQLAKRINANSKQTAKLEACCLRRGPLARGRIIAAFPLELFQTLSSGTLCMPCIAELRFFLLAFADFAEEDDGA